MLFHILFPILSLRMSTFLSIYDNRFTYYFKWICSDDLRELLDCMFEDENVKMKEI